MKNITHYLPRHQVSNIKKRGRNVSFLPAPRLTPVSTMALACFVYFDGKTPEPLRSSNKITRKINMLIINILRRYARDIEEFK